MKKVPVNQWVDIIVHVKFSETNNGELEVWARTAGSAWSVTPQISRYNVPTLQYIPGGKSTKVPTTIHTSSLYLEMGLYKGGSSTNSTDVVYQDGFRRGTSLAIIKSGFPK